MSAIVKDMLKNYYSLDIDVRLELDTAISDLVNSDVITDDEIIILRLTLDGTPHKIICTAVNLSKSTVNKSIIKIASRIAERLGGEYQDTKIISETEKRLGRPLTKKELSFCKKVIKGGRAVGDGKNIYNFNG